MKRTKQPPPPPAAEPWNTPTPAVDTHDVTDNYTGPAATGHVDVDGPAPYAPAGPAGPSDAPTVEMPAVDDDARAPIGEHPTAPAPPRPPRRRSSFRSAAIAAGGLAAVAVIGAVSLVVLLDGGSDTGGSPAAIAPDPPSSSVAAPAPVDPNADCPTSTTGPVSTGRDAGDFTTGAGVIKKYDYAFYISRSGADARTTGAPGANMGSPQLIQASIDATPTGTRHCLSITDRGDGLFDVTLTQTPPGGGAPTIYQQKFQTTVINGRTLIARNLLNTKVQ